MRIRQATADDVEAIWTILEPIVRAGETYTLRRDLNRDDVLAFWMAPGHEAFVAEHDGRIAGTYFLRTNQPGGGAHIANCGYATAGNAQGRGIAGAMCVHSLERARERGFRGMQYNFVVSTNERAVALWERHGFRIVGTLPNAFEHPTHGFVDAYIMFATLSDT